MRPPHSAIAIVSALATILVSNPVRSAEGATDTDAAQPSVWTPKKLHFTFSGFTTKYSCDGLRDKMRQALLELGARKDLHVTEGACSSPAGGPEPFPNVDIEIHVLEPTSSAATSKSSAATSKPATAGTADGRPVPAHWKAIDLKLDKDPLWQAEDCELLEQIKHRVFPLFATRNVDYHSSCVAHQVSLGGTWLRAQVLVPDQEPPPAENHR